MSQGLAADISALGRLTDRQSVLDYGLRDIVRRVQQVDGFNSYLEFESAMQALFREIQASISAQMQAGGPEKLAKAKEMLLLNCELQHLLERSALCKYMNKGRQIWAAQRQFLLQSHGWDANRTTTSGKEFKAAARLLQTCYRLHADGDTDDPLSSGPFGRGGVFSGHQADGGRREGRKCHNCGQVGHISRDCKKARDPSSIKCYRCGGSGHTSKDCDGVRLP
jgi:hypothetical protein